MAEKKDKGDPRKLTVVSIGDLITQGEGKNGHWELHKIKAVDAAGNEITQELKTFADLTPLLGKLEDYFVEKDERTHNDKVYVSYLVTPKSSQLQLKVDGLIVRVEELERQMAAMSGGAKAPDSTPPVGAPGAGAPAAAGSSPATSEDDIPF